MNGHQLEARVLRIADRVKAGQPIEDSCVELKKEWPRNHNKAARQLGGLANASRGEPIIWIIGIDERSHSIIGAAETELANWRMQVGSQFDGIAPRMICNRGVPYDQVTLVAMLFDTEERPFVVKSAAGGSITHDVPWRYGNDTYSARRSELIRVLSPMARLPRLEVMSARLSYLIEPSNPSKCTFQIGFGATFYLVPNGSELITVAPHLLSADFQFEGTRESFQFESGTTSRTSLLSDSADQVHFEKPGNLFVRFQTSVTDDRGEYDFLNPVRVNLRIGFAQIEDLHRLAHFRFEATGKGRHELAESHVS